MLSQLNTGPVDCWRHDFHGIPVRSSSFRHPLDRDLVCVDSAVSVQDGDGREQAFFGHAAGPDHDAAVRRSCYEILERLLASRLVFSAEQLASGWPGRYLFREGTTAPFPPARVLVREPADGRSDAPVTSASGLGLGPCAEQEQAIAHAGLEIVERHLLTSTWYAGLRLASLGEAEAFPGGYRLACYTSLDAVPFVLAVLSPPDGRGFYCGSAVRPDMKASIAHARAEALQLATNFLVKGMSSRKRTEWRGNVSSTIERIARLEGSGALAMHAHLATRVEPRAAPPGKLSDWRAILACALPRHQDTAVVPLGCWGEFGAVRVIAEHALTKNAMRHAHAHSGHIDDPFC